MNKFIVGFIAGVLCCVLALCVYWVAHTVSIYRNSNVVGARSSESPDGRWNIWVNDEYIHDLGKNFLSFGIYGTNGHELAYTRLEHRGGTARSSTITWNAGADCVTVSAPLNYGGIIRDRVEIQYDFVGDQLKSKRIPNREPEATR